MTNKLKIPVLKSGGCVQYGGMIVCYSTPKSELLQKKHLKFIGKGEIKITAEEAHLLRFLIDESHESRGRAVINPGVRELDRKLWAALCDWCEGLGWQVANIGENMAACQKCKGNGLIPKKLKAKKR